MLDVLAEGLEALVKNRKDEAVQLALELRRKVDDFEEYIHTHEECEIP